MTGEATVTVGDATVTLSLTGEGDEPTTSTLPQARRFRIEPSDVSFGEVPLGSSATQTVTITNNIDQPQSSVVKSIYVPTVEGATAAWTYTETCTGATLQPDESCTVTFTFTPHTEGSLIQLAALNLIGPYTADNWVTLRGVGGTLPATTTTTTVLVPPEQALRADVSAVDFGSVARPSHVLAGDADERRRDGVAGGLPAFSSAAHRRSDSDTTAAARAFDGTSRAPSISRSVRSTRVGRRAR